MLTITDVIKYQVARQSQEIHRLKAEALKTKAYEKYQYVSLDGKTRLDKRPDPSQAADYKLQKVTGVRVVQQISPKHPGWRAYRAAKGRVSLLLTARLLLKLNGENLPDFPTIRRMLSNPCLRNHARRGQSNSLCYAAFRYLRKLNNRLNRAPQRFAEVSEWLQDRMLNRETATLEGDHE